MAEAPTIRPFVNDSFWFSLSGDLVTKSLNRHEEAAAKFQTLVIWLWGIYTSYAAVGAALANKALPTWVILFVASASAALICVYWMTVWVQAPVPATFDPRSPDSIEAAFSGILVERQFRLRVTLVGSIVAAFLVALALMLMSTVPEQKAARPGLQAALVKTPTGSEIALLATVPMASKVIVRVEALDPKKGVAVVARTIIPSETGVIQTNIGLEPSTIAALVSAEWTGPDGVAWTLSREVRAAAEPKK